MTPERVDSISHYLFEESLATGRIDVEDAVLTLVPNPVHDWVRIEGNEQFMQDCSVVLQDMFGKKLGIWKMREATLTLPTAGLAKGMYCITVTTPEGEGTSLKFIKQ